MQLVEKGIFGEGSGMYKSTDARECRACVRKASMLGCLEREVSWDGAQGCDTAEWR